MFTKNGESIGGVASDFVHLWIFVASVPGLVPVAVHVAELFADDPQ